MSKRKHTKTHSRAARSWRRYGYKHTTLAIIVTLVFVLALDTTLVKALLEMIRTAGHLGILVTGMLFVSFFTAAPATVILLSLAENYNLFLISAIAGAGSLIGDWIILRFFEENVAYELRPVARKYGIMPIIRQMKTKRFRPIAILAGMLFIASPGPDEVGLGLLGVTKVPARRLIPLLFALNTGGIFLMLSAARGITEL